MKIVLVGAGRLAFNLGQALVSAGHDIMQVYSRTQESASRVSEAVGASPVTDISKVLIGADVYIVALKDSVLADIIPLLCKGREQSVFLHTAGSMPMDIFQGMTNNYGVLYPLQTFSNERTVDFSEIPFFIESSNEKSLNVAHSLASSVSNRITKLSSVDRKYIHLAAVFACNFTNHCYTMASDILARYDLPFEYLLPLIDETARKVHDMSPIDAQTGPAVRYDENIIHAQGNMLRYDPFLKDIYDRMSMDIHRKATSKQEAND